MTDSSFENFPRLGPNSPFNKPNLTTNLNCIFGNVLNNEKIYDEDISNVIQNFYEKFKSKEIIFIGLHSIDPYDFNLYFPCLSFLKNCSSVPLYHSEKVENVDSSNRKKFWRYLEIESMNSRILWPIKPSLDIEKLKSINTYDLFKDYLVTFKVENSSWKDDIVFHPEDSSDKNLLNLIINKYQSHLEDENQFQNMGKYQDIYCCLFKILSNGIEIDSCDESNISDHYFMKYSMHGKVFGRFRRKRNGESGFFVYFYSKDKNSIPEHLPNLIILFWNKYEFDFLTEDILIPNAQQNENSISKFDLSFSFKNDNSDEYKGDNGTILNMKLNKVIQSDLLTKHEGRDPQIENEEEIRLENSKLALLDHRDSIVELSTLIASHSKLSQCHIPLENPTNSINSILLSNFIAKKFDFKNIFRPFLLQEKMLEIMGFPLTSSKVKTFYDSASQLDWGKQWAHITHSFASRGIIVQETQGSQSFEEGEISDHEISQKYCPSLLQNLNFYGFKNNQLIHDKEYPLIDNIDKVLPFSICAIDCEMCSSIAGSELTRISLIGFSQFQENGVFLFDTLVKPVREIIDYHTKYSGITQDDLKTVSTTYLDIISILKHLIDKETILIGHSLDADLKVLQIIHRNIIDTSALYPHPNSAPYKHSLKFLAEKYLSKSIQDGEDGHDSIEDSLIALELVLVKLEKLELGVKEEDWLKKKLYMDKYTLFDELCSISTCIDHFPESQSMDINIYSYPHLPFDSLWENISFGLRPDGDANHVMKKFLQKRYPDASNYLNEANSGVRLSRDGLNVNCFNCGSNEQVLDGFLSNYQTKGLVESDLDRKKAKSFYWLDFNFNSSIQDIPFELSQEKMKKKCDQSPSRKKHKKNNKESNSNEKKEDSKLLAFLLLDQYIDSIFSKISNESIVLIATQGPIEPAKLKVSKKLRNRWEMLSNKKRTSSNIFQDFVKAKAIKSWKNLVHTYWDQNKDEPELMDTSSRAISGCLFIKEK